MGGWWAKPLQPLPQGLVLTFDFDFDPELDNLLHQHDAVEHQGVRYQCRYPDCQFKDQKYRDKSNRAAHERNKHGAQYTKIRK